MRYSAKDSEEHVEQERDTLDVLREIEFHLSVLTYPARRAAGIHFEEEVLRTEPRKNMFRLFNGSRTPTDVAEAAGTTAQAVRDLIKVLLAKGFIELELKGATQIVRPNRQAIMQWHLEAD